MPGARQGLLGERQIGLADQHIVGVERRDREDCDACLSQRLRDCYENPDCAEIERAAHDKSPEPVLTAHTRGYLRLRAENRQLVTCSRHAGQHLTLRPGRQRITGIKPDDGELIAQQADIKLRWLHAAQRTRSTLRAYATLHATMPGRDVSHRAARQRQMAWEFSTDPEFEQQLAWMRDFVREEIWPIETIYADLSQRQLERIYAPLQERVKERGLWAAHLDPELGGQGFGQVKLGLMHEVLGTSAFAPNAFGCQAPDSGNSEILALAGTPGQKERYLHPLLSGDLKSAFSMTEPNAGSDPTLLKTRAVRDGDEYVINGHKWFSSNASIADFLIVMAVTDPDARAHQRASMFLVPADTPGVNILRDVSTMEHPEPSFGKLGGHAEILYEDVRVPADALLGGEGQGFLIAQHRLVPGRIHHCMRWLGVSQRAFDMLCEYATHRYAFGSVLADKQTIKNWIADSAAQMHAARLMTLHAAWKMDTQGASAARQEVSLIKVYGAQVLHDVIDRALQIHGSLGYSTDMPLEAMYRFARGARFYDGPDEVHRESVARRILRGYEPPADGIPSEHVPTRQAAARVKFAAMLEAVTAND